LNINEFVTSVGLRKFYYM